MNVFLQTVSEYSTHQIIALRNKRVKIFIFAHVYKIVKLNEQ